MQHTLQTNLNLVRRQIDEIARRYGRSPETIALLAVSKTRPAEEILEALAAGQQQFGESYLQEALTKIGKLQNHGIEWHFIGRVQSNKTKPIAEHFAWVHSVDSARQARRLNDHRPASLPPLNLCLQIKIDPEESKGGLLPEEAAAIIKEIPTLPRLRLPPGAVL